ncbi:endoribonuclease YbeY isoform X1 [Tamandua tetradactyla]|uniref:endoribonuclease YbeY isoform X1 n=1 Tax=Tamandua tetradactyla TaxID=48850 RepID=UPI004053E81F
MSLVLRNLQRVVPMRRAPLRRRIEILRSILGVQGFDLGVICVDNRAMQHLNRTYRERNAPTDVLSFPFHENLKAGEIPQPDFPDDCNLGDIFLGVEYIFQQCEEDEDYYDALTGFSGDAFLWLSNCTLICLWGTQCFSVCGRGSRAPEGLMACQDTGDCHPWALPPPGVHTWHGGRVATDAPEGEAGAGGGWPTHGDPAPAPEQWPLLTGTAQPLASSGPILQAPETPARVGAKVHE